MAGSKYGKKAVKNGRALGKAAKKNPAGALLLVAFLLLAVGVVAVLNALGILSIFPDRNIRRDVPVAEGQAEYHFIDVGQGDALLIRTPEGNMLVDAGPPSAKNDLLQYLDQLGVTSLKYAFFTHPHDDHMGCAAAVLDRLDVETVVLSVSGSETSYLSKGFFEKTIDVIDKKNIALRQAKPGDAYTLGGVRLTVLAPLSDNYKDVNNTSLVMIADFGETSVMLTGDAEDVSEKEILKTYAPADLACDLLKVGHHGSDSSTTAEFLAAVAPKVAVISVGEGNIYGHPHAVTLDKLAARGVTVYETRKTGSLVFVSDGKILKKQ